MLSRPILCICNSTRCALLIAVLMLCAYYHEPCYLQYKALLYKS